MTLWWWVCSLPKTLGWGQACTTVFVHEPFHSETVLEKVWRIGLKSADLELFGNRGSRGFAGFAP